MPFKKKFAKIFGKKAEVAAPESEAPEISLNMPPSPLELPLTAEELAMMTT